MLLQLTWFRNLEAIEVPEIYKALDKVLNFKNFPRQDTELPNYGKEEV